jgi:hypothetical protein
MEGLLIETETDTTVIKKMKKVTRENIRRRYERNQSENECMPVLPLALILHPRFKDMNFLDEDDRNAAIELLKANALPSIFFNSGITAGSVGSDSLDKIIVARLNGSKSLTTFSISSCSSKDRSILISIAFFTLGSIKTA